MSDLNNRPMSLKLKQGLFADINTTATKNTAVLGELHYCTDTGELYIFNGTENVLAGPWKLDASGIYYDGDINFTGTRYNYDPTLTDIGANTKNPLDGYSKTYITDKELANVSIGGNVVEVAGAIRNVDNVLSIYNETSGAWEAIVKNFVLAETDSGRMLLIHKPIGFTEYLTVENEDSYQNIATNGLPITQGEIGRAHV